MDMKQSYQGVLKNIEAVVLAHPMVNSVDNGRELEFDVKKSSLFPRGFIRTIGGSVTGGHGSAEVTLNFSLLIADRLNTKRTNMVSALNDTHAIMLGVVGTLVREQLIDISGGLSLTPVMDYHDTQVAGWQFDFRVILDTGLQCYDVDING